MKNIKNKILCAIIIALAATTVITATIIAINNFHSRVAMVTEINSDNNIITVTCGNGNMFSFYGECEDWMCGDLCSLIMYDNGTENVYDDKIVNVRYGGYIGLFEEIEETIN